MRKEDRCYFKNGDNLLSLGNPETQTVHKIHFLALLLCLFLSASARNNIQIQAAPSWLQTVNDDLNKKPASARISNGYYYELIDRQINLVNQTKYFHFVRQIVNESGVQDASEVSVYFSPQFQRVIFHTVCIIRNGKVINRLNANDIKVVQEETEASDYQYTGIKRAYITLRDVRKADRVEYAYSVVGFNPVFSGRYSEEFFFNSQTAVTNYYLTLLAEPSRILYIKTYNKAPMPLQQPAGPYKIYQWNNPEIAVGQTESNSPSWFTADPYVSITEYESWERVAAWGLDIFNHYQYSISASLERKIAEWHRNSSGDPDKFANLALRFVQDQVRYMGLEIGVYTHQPHAPSEVFDRRFGDCKDKALLLATILRHEHIEAYVALVNTLEKEKLAQDPPAATSFDHAIVALKRSSGFVFVDPTISMQRGELINSFIPAYGYALVLRPGETNLQPVDPGFLYNISVSESAIAEDADSSLFLVRTVYSGGAADDMRGYFASNSQQEIEDNYTKYYAGIFEGIAIMKPVEVTDDSLKNELSVEETYGIPGIWHKQDDGKKQLNVFAKTLGSRIPDPGSGNTSPVALSYPFSIQYDLQLKMPIEFPKSIKSFHVKNDCYQFDFSPEEKGKLLTYHYKFKTFRDYIPSENIVQYKKDYKEIDKCLSLSFSRNDISAAGASAPDTQKQGEFNWVLVWVAFFFGVAFTSLCRYLNRKTILQEYDGETGWPLGGWTLFLGITIGIRIVLQIYVSWQQHYFQQDTWAGLGNLGGARLKGMLVFELFMALFSLGGSIALLYWFLNKRDIFPKMFVYYFSGVFALQLVQLILYYLIAAPVGDLKQQLATGLFRSLIYGMIWITYILKSERVRNTFVYPPGQL